MKKYFVFAIMMMACVCGSVSLTACGSDDDDLEVVDKSKVMKLDDLVGKWYGVYSERDDKSDAVNAMLEIEKGGTFRAYTEGAFGNYTEIVSGTVSIEEVKQGVIEGLYKLTFFASLDDGALEYEWTRGVTWGDDMHKSIKFLDESVWVRK